MNYLLELLIDFKTRNNYTQNELTALMGCKARNIPKYLSGELNVTYNILRRFLIKPNKRILKSNIKRMINEINDLELLCDVYNKLYKHNIEVVNEN